MNTTGRDGVHIGSQSSNQCLTFTRLHLSDVAKVKCPTTHQLNVEVAKTKSPLRRLSHCRERFWQKFIQGFTGCVTGTELLGFTSELFITEVRERIFQSIDCLRLGREFLQDSAFPHTEKALKYIRHKYLAYAIWWSVKTG